MLGVEGAASSVYCDGPFRGRDTEMRKKKKLPVEGTQSPCSYGGGSSSRTFPRSLHLALELVSYSRSYVDRKTYRRKTVRPTAVPIRAALMAPETIVPASVRRRLAGGRSIQTCRKTSMRIRPPQRRERL